MSIFSGSDANQGNGHNVQATIFVYTSRYQLNYNPWINNDMFDDYEFNTQLADSYHKVNVGVNDIERVSTKVYKDEVDDDLSCPICIEKINESDDIQYCRILVCRHIYCDKCITRWLKINKHCPLCKVHLEEKVKVVQNI